MSAISCIAPSILTRYSLPLTNSPHLVPERFQDPSVALPRICTAAPCYSFSSCPSLFVATHPLSFSLRSNTRPFHCLSCRSPWAGTVLVPKSARFSADAPAPTVTTPRFTNCFSQRTFVDKWRMVPTPSRLHMPHTTTLSSKGSVRTSQSHEQLDFSDQHCLTGGQCCSMVLSFAT